MAHLTHCEKCFTPRMSGIGCKNCKRDEFIAAALTGVLANPNHYAERGVTMDNCVSVAIDAADAMMKAREQTNEG